MGLFDFFLDALTGAQTAAHETFRPDDQHLETNPHRAHDRARQGSGFWTGYAGEKAYTDNHRGEGSKAPKRWLF